MIALIKPFYYFKLQENTVIEPKKDGVSYNKNPSFQESMKSSS